MKLWRPVSRPVCTAIIITSLSYFADNRLGEYLLLPGAVIEITLTWLILLIPTGDEYFSFPSGTYFFFNVAFYAAVMFTFISLLKHVIKPK